MEPVSFFNTNKERRWFFFIIFLILSFNLFTHYLDYKKFIKNEVFDTTGTVENIYFKKKHNVLKVSTENFTFFTSSSKNLLINKFDFINIFIVSKNINFLNYLKGFYTNSFSITQLENSISNKESIHTFISSQHANDDLSSLYSALYLATSLTDTVRDLSADLGISHLIAISGFHLGVMSFVLYFLFHPIYSKLHQKYFPYRNKKLDIMIAIVVVLFLYLIFLNLPPSLLRAFTMFVFALFLLRNNIKVLSFETLFIISIFIIAIFPKLLFSLSLWFSICGVFYIFLFIQYFHTMNKYIQVFFFNFWIYFAMNPITHYFFGTLSKEQLYSPMLTLFFTIFYPLSIVLHIFGIGDLMDPFLQYMINMDIYVIEVLTPFWLFCSFIILSLLSIISTHAFVVLNIVLVTYSLWLFHFMF